MVGCLRAGCRDVWFVELPAHPQGYYGRKTASTYALLRQRESRNHRKSTMFRNFFYWGSNEQIAEAAGLTWLSPCPVAVRGPP